MYLNNGKNKKLSSDPLLKDQQECLLLQHINKFKNSTGLPGFT